MLQRHSILTTLALLACGWLLAACGQAAAPASTTAVPPTAEPATMPAVQTPSYADIPQGQTPEGYQALGDPAAPVTLVMYSDFL